MRVDHSRPEPFCPTIPTLPARQTERVRIDCAAHTFAHGQGAQYDHTGRVIASHDKHSVNPSQPIAGAMSDAVVRVVCRRSLRKRSGVGTYER